MHYLPFVIVTVPGAIDNSPAAQADLSSSTLAGLAGLPIKGRAPRTRYTGSEFGDPRSDDVQAPADTMVAIRAEGCTYVSPIVEVNAAPRPWGTRWCFGAGEHDAMARALSTDCG